LIEKGKSQDQFTDSRISFTNLKKIADPVMRARSNDHRFVQNTLRIFCRDLANVLPAAIHLKAWLRSREGSWVGNQNGQFPPAIRSNPNANIRALFFWPSFEVQAVRMGLRTWLSETAWAETSTFE